MRYTRATPAGAPSNLLAKCLFAGIQSSSATSASASLTKPDELVAVPCRGKLALRRRGTTRLEFGRTDEMKNHFSYIRNVRAINCQRW